MVRRRSGGVARYRSAILLCDACLLTASRPPVADHKGSEQLVPSIQRIRDRATRRARISRMQSKNE